MARGKKTGGRKAGTPNVTSGELREMIVAAVSQKGGVAYFVRQADENPTAFMALIGKILPMQVTGENGAAIRAIHEIVLRGVRPDPHD